MAKRAILISNKETERTFAIRMISINKYIYIYIYMICIYQRAKPDVKS